MSALEPTRVWAELDADDRLLDEIAGGRRARPADRVAAFLAAWKADVDADPFPIIEMSPEFVQALAGVAPTRPAPCAALLVANPPQNAHPQLHATGSDAADRPGGVPQPADAGVDLDAATVPIPRVRATFKRPAPPPRIHPDYRALLDSPLEGPARRDYAAFALRAALVALVTAGIIVLIALAVAL